MMMEIWNNRVTWSYDILFLEYITQLARYIFPIMLFV